MWTLSRLSKIKEAHAANISKVQAIENLNYTFDHISPARMHHMVENGQWSWTYPLKSMNCLRELPPCSNCALAKAKRSSFKEPITIPGQIGGLVIADIQGPFEFPSLDGNVYEVGILETKPRYIWMTMAESKNVDGVLNSGWRTPFLSVPNV